MSNSGSGNQGITATVPVMVVAEHFGADEEKLARALMLSHLSAIYIHHQLPRLSALCAATTAAMGAAAGMAWIVDGRYNTIAMAISSMIGDVSGMICDGAKQLRDESFNQRICGVESGADGTGRYCRNG